jgi:cell division protein FtsB
MKTEELRVYLNESSEIDKNYIKHIFEWQISNQRSEEQQQKILKDLSHKVKALIKENHELRHYCSNEEWVSLKKENEALKAMIDQFHRGEAARENILSEENRYLREYIERHQEDVEK